MRPPRLGARAAQAFASERLHANDAVYSGDTAKDHDLRISHVAIDRKHTTAEDSGSYFPLPELRHAAGRGRIGSVAPRFHGLPTNRSHRTTLETDCPELVARCLDDGVDGALLVPNCPVCHQSVSLAARALEERGIATVVMGCAKDIVEYVGVPRLLFSDFPLGNAAGRPHDPQSQALTLDLALRFWRRAGCAHHRAVAAHVERQSRLEARLSAISNGSPPKRSRRAAQSSTGPKPWPRRCAQPDNAPATNSCSDIAVAVRPITRDYGALTDETNSGDGMAGASTDGMTLGPDYADLDLAVAIDLVAANHILAQTACSIPSAMSAFAIRAIQTAICRCRRSRRAT